MTHLSPAFSLKERLSKFMYNLSLYFALSIWTAGLLAAFGATAVTVLGLLRGQAWALVSLAILVSSRVKHPSPVWSYYMLAKASHSQQAACFPCLAQRRLSTGDACSSDSCPA
jgi:hypothetical protein